MNPRRLIARLNAKSMSLTGVGGVPPELTAADIAGAIGMIRNKFNREMFCAIWWPDGTDMLQVMQLVAERQRAEVERQLRAREIARLEEMLAEESLSELRTLRARRIVERLRARSRASDALCWPPVGHLLRQVRLGVFTEIMHPRRCPQCRGVGYAIDGERPKMCNRCDGAGVAAMSLQQRAKMFNMRLHQFRNSRDVRPLYEWTYEMVRDGESAGADELARKLAHAAPQQNIVHENVQSTLYNACDATGIPCPESSCPGASPVAGAFCL